MGEGLSVADAMALAGSTKENCSDMWGGGNGM